MPINNGAQLKYCVEGALVGFRSAMYARFVGYIATGGDAVFDKAVKRRFRHAWKEIIPLFLW